jgi:hypothetical protein
VTEGKIPTAKSIVHALSAASVSGCAGKTGIVGPSSLPLLIQDGTATVWQISAPRGDRLP